MVALVALAAPASAQYGTTPSPGVSDPTPSPGATVIVSGTNCQNPATVLLDGVVVATVEVDADGTFAVEITVPTTPGTYVLEVRCEPLDPSLDSGMTDPIPDCQVPPGTSSANSACLLEVVGDQRVVTAAALPRTGGDTLPLARLGVILVALGGLVVLAARKKRSAVTS